MRQIRVAGAQFEHSPSDKAANLARVEWFTQAAAARGVQSVVFPECCLTGVLAPRHLGVEDLHCLAEAVPGGPSTQSLLSLSARHGIKRSNLSSEGRRRASG